MKPRDFSNKLDWDLLELYALMTEMLPVLEERLDDMLAPSDLVDEGDGGDTQTVNS